MVHHVRVGQTPDSLEAREMINEFACELLQALQGSELLSGDGLGDLAVVATASFAAASPSSA